MQQKEPAGGMLCSSAYHILTLSVKLPFVVPEHKQTLATLQPGLASAPTLHEKANVAENIERNPILDSTWCL